MRRRDFIVLVGGAAASWLRVARAQQPTKTFRVGILESVSATQNATELDAFRQGLQQFGYLEGSNLVIEHRSADGHNDRFPALAAELIQLPVDVIVTRGTPATLAVQKANTTIPVVMAANANPLRFVASLARPGGNITGLSSLVGDLQPKRLELLKELVPGLARIAYLTNMSNPVATEAWKKVEGAARVLRLEPHLLDVRKTGDIAPAFELASELHVQGLLVGNEGLMHANRDLVARLTIKHRLPAIYGSREFVKAGAMMIYGVNYPDLYRRAAIYVDKILKGTRPGDIPIEQPTKFELFINLRTANAIGVKIPEAFLLRADKVIE